MKSPEPFRPVTYLDDVCALIGFAATSRLIAWHGGEHIYVPVEATPEHALAALMGDSALRALVDEFGGQTLWIPADIAGADRQNIQNKRAVAKLTNKGRSPQEIAVELGLSSRHVMRIIAELRSRGLIPHASKPALYRAAEALETAAVPAAPLPVDPAPS